MATDNLNALLARVRDVIENTPIDKRLTPEENVARLIKALADAGISQDECGVGIPLPADRTN